MNKEAIITLAAASILSGQPTVPGTAYHAESFIRAAITTANVIYNRVSSDVRHEQEPNRFTDRRDR